MIYINKINLPSDIREVGFFSKPLLTCYSNIYPFKIFPEKMLESVKFDNITIFYGGNGSGKSTLINIISTKMNAIRFSDFNNSHYFQDYLNMCSLDYYKHPKNSYVLTSDDVFEYVLSARTINENVEEKKNALIEKYDDIQEQFMKDPSIYSLRGIHDFERWKEVKDVISPKRSKSSYIKNRSSRDIDLFSNGETALNYFYDKIDEDAVYFLDEPENSLSVELQAELAQFIEATARAARSQFIIATHSPILLSMRGAKIYNLDSIPAAPCKWTELPNVRRYYDFFMEHSEEFEN